MRKEPGTSGQTEVREISTKTEIALVFKDRKKISSVTGVKALLAEYSQIS